jgi:hypothetical protein
VTVGGSGYTVLAGRLIVLALMRRVDDRGGAGHDDPSLADPVLEPAEDAADAAGPAAAGSRRGAPGTA